MRRVNFQQKQKKKKTVNWLRNIEKVHYCHSKVKCWKVMGQKKKTEMFKLFRNPKWMGVCISVTVCQSECQNNKLHTLFGTRTRKKTNNRRVKMVYNIHLDHFARIGEIANGALHIQYWQIGDGSIFVSANYFYFMFFFLFSLCILLSSKCWRGKLFSRLTTHEWTNDFFFPPKQSGTDIAQNYSLLICHDVVDHSFIVSILCFAGRSVIKFDRFLTPIIAFNHFWANYLLEWKVLIGSEELYWVLFFLCFSNWRNVKLWTEIDIENKTKSIYMQNANRLNRLVRQGTKSIN